MKIKLPEEVKPIMERIIASGYDIYLVGGAVRDYFLGKETNDYDLCTDMPLDLLKMAIPAFHIMKENDHRNTGTMTIGDIRIDISTIKGKNIEEDLSRRDFTMNAIAATKDGYIIDPFYGVEDIKNKRINLVLSDASAIDKDPLRILRAIRLSATLGFEIDEETRKVLVEKKDLLRNIPAERIYSELKQILISDDPAKVIRENKEVFFEIIPELRPLDGFDQHNSYHVYDIFEHTLKTLENTPNDLVLRLAALFHDIGKPQTYTQDERGVGHFYGHPKVSGDIFKAVATRLKIDNDTTSVVLKLIENHDRILSLKKPKALKFIQDFGTEEIGRLFALKEADIRAQNPELIEERVKSLESEREAYNKFLEEKPVLSVKDLKINGKQIQKMGFYDKHIGYILKDILTQVTEDKLENTEEAIEEYVRRTYK